MCAGGQVPHQLHRSSIYILKVLYILLVNKKHNVQLYHWGFIGKKRQCAVHAQNN